MKPLPKLKKDCMGPSCKGCSSSKCYAEGGDVKGVHSHYESRIGASKGLSKAGDEARWSQATHGLDSSQDHLSKAKKEHKRVLGEMRSMKKPNLYDHGGEVEIDPVAEIEWEEHKLKALHDKKHEKKLGEKKHYAEGGDVLEADDDMDMDGLQDELGEAVAGELLSALESKNKKEILEAIRAIVLSCKE